MTSGHELLVSAVNCRTSTTVWQRHPTADFERDERDYMTLDLTYGYCDFVLPALPLQPSSTSKSGADIVGLFTTTLHVTLHKSIGEVVESTGAFIRKAALACCHD